MAWTKSLSFPLVAEQWHKPPYWSKNIYTSPPYPFKGIIGSVADQLWIPCPRHHYYLHWCFALRSTLILSLLRFCALMADSIWAIQYCQSVGVPSPKASKSICSKERCCGRRSIGSVPMSDLTFCSICSWPVSKRPSTCLMWILEFLLIVVLQSKWGNCYSAFQSCTHKHNQEETPGNTKLTFIYPLKSYGQMVHESNAILTVGLLPRTNIQSV